MSLVDLVQACNEKSEKDVTELVKQPAIKEHLSDLVESKKIKNPKWDSGIQHITALHVACRHADHKIVTALLDNGARTDVQHSRGSYPVHWACESKTESLPKVKSLVAKDRNNIHVPGYNGWTPLHYASHYGAHEVVVYLVDNGAEINGLDKKTWPALHHATHYGVHDTVVYLLDKGANVNTAGSSGWTALHHAARRGTRSDVVSLLDHGANVNAVTSDGSTALHYAARSGAQDVVVYLIDKGIDINAADSDGSTALHDAALENRARVIKILMEKSIDINKQDKFGCTALHDAVKYAKLDAVKALTSHAKCNINVKNKKGKTPLDVATAKPKKEFEADYDDVIKHLKNIQSNPQQSAAANDSSVEQQMSTLSTSQPDDSQNESYLQLQERMKLLEAKNKELENEQKKMASAKKESDRNKKMEEEMNSLKATIQTIHKQMETMQKQQAQPTAASADTTGEFDDKLIAEAVRHHMEHLKENLRSDDHVDFLFSKKVLSSSESEEVEAQPSSEKQMRKLLRIVLSKKDHSWAPIFLQSLKKTHTCVKAVELIEVTCRSPHQIRPSTAK